MFSCILEKLYATDLVALDSDESSRNLVHAPNVSNYENVKIFKKMALITDSKDNVIRLTTNEHLFWVQNYVGMNRTVDERLSYLQEQVYSTKKSNGLIINSDVSCVYLGHPFEWYAYGHVFDSLQRLYNINNKKFVGPYLICSEHSRVSDFYAHLELLGYRKDFLITMHGFFDYISVKKLVYSESPANITQFTNDTRDWIRDRYISKGASEVSNYVLFLDRGSVGTRDVINKKELLDCLSLKFNLIRFTGSESLGLAIDLFSKARYVVGVHGAMFVNTIFCSKDCKIIEMIPSGRRVVNMLRMNKSALNHVGLVFDSDSNHQFSVNPQLIIDELLIS